MPGRLPNKEQVLAVLDPTQWNNGKAPKVLGCLRVTVHRFMKFHANTRKDDREGRSASDDRTTCDGDRTSYDPGRTIGAGE